ncbi:MAG: CHC2 zinc finger domain-containing protein, partial [Christensenellales bacterium]
MAGFFPPEWLEELRYKNDIVEIVSQYVTLKPKGKKHWGLCPFHGEKTPSFSVDAEKQFYYCFGCHAGGDVVHFVMGMEKLTFPETIELMAQRSGMDLPERRGDAGASKRAAKEREQLYALNRDAALYFISELSKSEFAMKFIAERGIDK